MNATAMKEKVYLDPEVDDLRKEYLANKKPGDSVSFRVTGTVDESSNDVVKISIDEVTLDAETNESDEMEDEMEDMGETDMGGPSVEDSLLTSAFTTTEEEETV